MLTALKDYLRKKTKYGKNRYLSFLYRYDMSRFLSYSCMNENDPERLATKIRLLAHAIEKGMSLRNCKPGFGKEKILELISYCEQYENSGSFLDSQAILLAHETVKSYMNWQKQHGVIVDFVPESYLRYKSVESISAGVIELDAKKGTDFENIAYGRHSSRCYSEHPVPEDLVRKIVRIAQTAPSACNRQATRVHVCTDRNKVSKVMRLHGGARGFDTPGAIFVITEDLHLYQNEYERNTAFVDGGIFVMNLLYALDSVGLVGCPLIWGSDPSDDEQLSEMLHIPKCEKIIAWVSAGYYPGEKYMAACSAKRNIEDILYIDN